MKTIDWTELKEGDLFQMKNVCEKLKSGPFWFTVADSIFQMAKGQIRLWNSGGYICRHPSHPDFKMLDNFMCKQEVVVMQTDEVPSYHKISSMNQSRINHCTGTDPEVFVVRGAEKEELLPAFRFLPKQEEQMKKYAPQVDTSNFHPIVRAFAYRDGFAAECYTSPVSCHGYLIDFIRNGLRQVNAAAKTFDRTARLTVKGSFLVPEEVMKNSTDEDVALGCMPSRNAYGHEANLALNAREFRMRFAGGHIHLGLGKTATEKDVEIVKGCDLIAGMAGVAIFANLDDPTRRNFYGKAGEYRRPKHGIEYRTLSNAWLACPQVCHLMFNLTRIGAKVGFNDARKYFEIREEEVEEIINTTDVSAARKFLQKHAFAFKSLLAGEGLGTSEKHYRSFETITQGGLPELFPNYAKIDANWKLDGQWQDHTDNLRQSWEQTCHMV